MLRGHLLPLHLLDHLRWLRLLLHFAVGLVRRHHVDQALLGYLRLDLRLLLHRAWDRVLQRLLHLGSSFWRSMWLLGGLQRPRVVEIVVREPLVEHLPVLRVAYDDLLVVVAALQVVWVYLEHHGQVESLSHVVDLEQLRQRSLRVPEALGFRLGELSERLRHLRVDRR